MTANRLLDIFSLMERHDATHAGGLSLCAVAAEFVQVSGAGIVLASSDTSPTSLCTSSPLARHLMDLEIAIGEGPGLDASASGRANAQADLTSSHEARWLAFRAAAVAKGARAVFGFPVRIGAIHFGALVLHRVTPGSLSDAQTSDAFLMASVVGRAILTTQSGGDAASVDQQFKALSGLDLRVHQAAGMVAVQGATSVKDALVMIRSRAFATDTDVTDIASSIVERVLRFDATTNEWRRAGESE